MPLSTHVPLPWVRLPTFLVCFCNLVDTAESASVISLRPGYALLRFHSQRSARSQAFPAFKTKLLHIATKMPYELFRNKKCRGTFQYCLCGNNFILENTAALNTLYTSIVYNKYWTGFWDSDMTVFTVCLNKCIPIKYLSWESMIKTFLDGFHAVIQTAEAAFSVSLRLLLSLQWSYWDH
jgi:hypothetical protein